MCAARGTSGSHFLTGDAMKKFKPVCVFLGPSLGKTEARSLLDADYYPPARRGDIYRILSTGVQTIVLIDGVFHSTPTVWQRELLYAMQGVNVIGASSMGALRAAELHTLGMIGRGTVFEWYRDGTIDGDDEVALLHGSEESDYRPLSEPLVNIRCTFQAAVADRYLAEDEAKDLVAHAKQLFYAERSYSRLLRSPLLMEWSRSRVAKLAGYFSTRSVNIKRLDAMDAVRFAGRLVARRKAKRPRKLVQVKEETWTKHERLLATGFIGTTLVTGAAVLAAAGRDRLLVKTMRGTLPKRRFVLEWAMQNEITAPRGFRNLFASQWAADHGINNRSGWLPANGLIMGTYSDLLAERTLIEWALGKGPGYFGLERSFIDEWARQSGVSLPTDCPPRRSTFKSLEGWVIKRGPCYFGLDWRFEVAFLHELQLTGRAAEIVSALKAH